MTVVTIRFEYVDQFFWFLFTQFCQSAQTYTYKSEKVFFGNDDHIFVHNKFMHEKPLSTLDVEGGMIKLIPINPWC